MSARKGSLGLGSNPGFGVFSFFLSSFIFILISFFVLPLEGLDHAEPFCWK
jgi:hypothetical protein